MTGTMCSLLTGNKQNFSRPWDFDSYTWLFDFKADPHNIASMQPHHAERPVPRGRHATKSRLLNVLRRSRKKKANEVAPLLRRATKLCRHLIVAILMAFQAQTICIHRTRDLAAIAPANALLCSENTKETKQSKGKRGGWKGPYSIVAPQ